MPGTFLKKEKKYSEYFYIIIVIISFRETDTQENILIIFQTTHTPYSYGSIGTGRSGSS